MIERYGDHAANERTFLAWVRTAIAVMAFGFWWRSLTYSWRLQVKRSRAAPCPLAGSWSAILPLNSHRRPRP